MKRSGARALTLVALAAVLAVTDGSATTGSSRRVFPDPKGDACCTEDISRVVVASDDDGRITFRITAPLPNNGIAGGASDRYIPIETRRGRYQIATNPNGGGYVLGAWDDERSKFVTVARVRADEDGDDFVFFVDRHLVGDTDQFRFNVQFWSVTPLGGAYLEAAPDRGSWLFPVKIDLRRIRPVLRVRQARTTATQTLLARLDLMVAHTRRLLASGTISCVARVGARDLTLLERRFVRRRAICRWAVPRAAVGEVVHGAVGVRVTAARESWRGRRFRLVLR
jgi:hypothetical protein